MSVSSPSCSFLELSIKPVHHGGTLYLVSTFSATRSSSRLSSSYSLLLSWADRASFGLRGGTILPLALGILGWILFHIHQASSICKEPSMPPRLFKHRTSAAGLIIIFSRCYHTSSDRLLPPHIFSSCQGNFTINLWGLFPPFCTRYHTGRWDHGSTHVRDWQVYTPALVRLRDERHQGRHAFYHR